MKSLTIPEQVNACIKHANRQKQTITHFEFYPHGSENHQVIARLPQHKDGGYPYFSVAILIHIKNDTFIGAANESTWN